MQYQTSTVFAPKGAGALGIDWADVDAKYRTLMPQAQVSDQQVEASLQVIHDIANLTKDNTGAFLNFDGTMLPW